MKVKNLISLFILFYFVNSSQAQLRHKWSNNPKNFDLIGGDAFGISTATDATGNVYVIGYYDNTINFQPFPLVANISTPATSAIFFAKYDVNGSLLFVKNITGSIHAGKGSSIAIDGNGFVYITGAFEWTVDFDPGIGTANLTANAASDVFLAKYDSAGNYIYAYNFGGFSDGCSGSDLAIDIYDNVFLTGFFAGTTDFDPGSGVANLTGFGGETFLSKYDSSGNFVFVNKLGNAGNYSKGNSLATDAIGNIYVTGSFYNTHDFNPGAGTANLSSNGGADIFAAKYGPTGNYIFAIGIGAGGDDYASSIVIDNSGNVYLAGNYKGNVDFDPGSGTFILNSNDLVNSENFISKYNSSGDFIYAKSFGWVGDDLLTSMAIDNSDNIYVTGILCSTIDFDPDSGTADLTANIWRETFLAIYDASGNYLYAAAVGAGNNETQSNSIALDYNGNVFITGYFSEGTADFDPGAGVANLTTGIGNFNAFVCKYDSNLNYSWANLIGAYGNEVLNEEGKTIAKDASGNIYIAGNFKRRVDFDPGAGFSYLVSSGYSDIYISKYDASGNFLYAARIGGPEEENVTSIAVNNNNELIVTGSFRSSCDFDPGMGVSSLTTSGGKDIFIAKYNSVGSLLYAKRIGGTNDDAVSSLVLDHSDNISLIGSFSGSVDFDPDPSAAVLNSGNSFLAKYNSAGSYLYAKSLGTCLSNDISVDNNSNVYLTGNYQYGNDFDPGPGIANLTSPSGWGVKTIFIAKYDSLGNYVFAKPLNGNALNAGTKVTATSNGEFYIAGYQQYSNNVDMDPGPAVVTTNSSRFWVKFDSLGEFSFVREISASIEAIELNDNNEVFLCGAFQGTSNLEPGVSSSIMSAFGAFDIYIAKYDLAGNFLYVKNIGGLDNDRGNAIAVDSTGNVFITGYFTNQADFNVGGSDPDLFSINGQDIFVARYQEECLNSSVIVYNDSMYVTETGSYQWLNCDNNSIIGGANNQSYIATADGNYAVIITSGSCIDTTDCFNIVINLTGFTEPIKIFSLLVYPNPFSSSISVEITDDPKDPFMIEVINSIGQVIYNGSLKESKVIDLNNKQNGLHILKIFNNQYVFHKKIVKQ
jgi:hypothetical protein